MHYTLEFKQGIFEVKTSGDADVIMFKEFIHEIVNHEKWLPGNPILVDHTDMNAGPLESNDLKKIADYCKKYSKSLGPAKCAILAARDLEFGIGRMWQVFVEINVWDVTQQIFKTREKALEWLLD